VQKTLNGNMFASSRLLFAMRRRNRLDRRMRRAHPVNQTPSTAVIAVGCATVVVHFSRRRKCGSGRRLGVPATVPSGHIGAHHSPDRLFKYKLITLVALNAWL